MNNGVLNVNGAPFYVGAISANGTGYFFDAKYQFINIGMDSDLAFIDSNWFSGAGGAVPNMVFRTGGTERMRITSGGNVGIGTASPAELLDVNGNITLSGTVNRYIRINSASNYYYWLQSVGDDFRIVEAGTTPRLVITYPNGNVGLGTTTPATELQISKAGSSTLRLTNTSNTTNVELGIATALGFVGTNTDNSFAINTNNTERVRITNAGNVGIGTASPANKLDVFTTNRTALNTVGSGVNVNYNGTATGEYATIGFSWASSIGNNSTQWGMGMVGTNFGSGTAALNFFTNGSERMRITSDGNVGIGTASPSVIFQVVSSSTEVRIQSTTSTDGFIRYVNTSGSMSFGMSGAAINAVLLYDRTNSQTAYTYIGGASGLHAWYTNDAERMRITAAGEVWIGYTADQGAYALQVNGSVYATSYFESSDERLKNIVVAHNSDNFGAVEFTWKDGRDLKHHWGYSAQSVQKWLPDAVNENNDGFLTVDYNQAHTFKIQKLEEKIVNLEAKNTMLENEIANIKKGE